MKNLFFLLFVIGFTSFGYSQCCTYTLSMSDSYGDGWNGGSLNILVNGVSIGTFSASGSGSSANIPVCNGDIVEVIYSSGSWESENSYSIANGQGGAIWSDGPSPSTGSVVTFNADCASCSDGIQNGDEQGVDCGGCACAPCGGGGTSPNGATLTTDASTFTLPCGGGPVDLSALGNSSIPALGNDFNGGCIGPGWQTSPAGQFDNPCDGTIGSPPPNGTYMWMGQGTTAPRNMVSEPLDVSCGGEVCFYFVFIQESFSGETSDCEGADYYNEGVNLQYSTDGGNTWVNIAYFAPNGDLLVTNPGTTSPSTSGVTNFTSWDQYCFTIPPGAETTTTQFQWYQDGSSGASFDHWGIDEITVTAQACNPYYYDWVHVPGSNDAPDVSVNPTTTTDYIVHYTNGINDTITDTITIVVDGPLTPDVSTVEEDCLGDNDATMTVDANPGGTAGNGPFTVDITGPVAQSLTHAAGAGAAPVTFTGLPPGNYTITVTDAGGCSSTASVTINPGPTCCTTTATPTDLTCNQNNQACDGQGTANPTGTAPFTYQWYTGTSVAAGAPIGGQTAQTAGGLCPGDYTVEITDNGGCTAEATITITEPTEVVLSLVGTDALCNGSADGTINASAVGGAGGYTFSDDGVSFSGTSTFTVGAGTYTIFVEDANGCPDQENIIINEPTPILPAIDAIVNSTCGQSDGGFTISATGGTPNYTYTQGGNTNTDGIFTGYAAGTYTVTIADGNNCTETIDVTVNDDAGPTASLDGFLDALCFGIPDGSATVLASGGTAPIEYSIDLGPFGPTNTFTNLAAGNHTVTIQDDNGCTDDITFTIGQPTQVSFTATPSDVTCNGVCDGEILVNASGGTPPYQYSVDFGLTYSTNNPITGLCAGNQTVVVQDDNGCTVNNNYVINEPTALTATFTPSDASCNGAADGSIVVNASGGTAPYDYSIDGAPAQTSATFNGLTAGTYQIDVIDDNGCVFTQNVTINEPASVAITLDLNQNSTCSNPNGIVNVSATGGDGNYTFTIDAGSPNATGVFNGLAAGTYTLAVSDGNACSDDITVTVIDEPEPVLDATVTDVSCNGGSDGSVLINVISGGTAPFQYSDDNITFGASNNFTGLSDGTYTFYVEDANGCTDDITVNVVEPTNAVVNFTPSDNSCFGACDGQVVVNVVSGGVAPYEYSSNAGISWQAGNTLTGICAGTHDIQVRDAIGCLLVTSIEVINEPAEIIPNPTPQIATCGNNNGIVDLAASGGVGAPFTYDWQVTGTFNGTTNYTGLAPGTYNFEVQDASGCIVAAIVNIGSADAPTIDNTTFVALDCNGDTDGEITVEASGGVGTIDYNINGSAFAPVGASPGPVTNTYSNLGNGTYTIGVQDDNGCVVFTTVDISNPSALNYGTLITDEPCNGDAVGEIEVIASGGSGTIYYSLNGAPPVTTNTFSNLLAGNYTIDVSDDNGCVVSSLETVAEPPLLDITGITGTDALCFGASDGTINITAVGGTAPILYSVDNGVSFQPTGAFTGLGAGTYAILVEDANGCVDNGTFDINEPVDLTFGAPTTNSTCSQNNGTITVNASGGTAPYEYSFDNGGTFGSGNTLTDFAGSFDVIVEDDNGCQEAATIIIVDEPAAIIDNITITDPLCDGSLDGEIVVTATGTATLTYSIDNGVATTNNTFNVGAGTYSVEVFDGNGCLTTGSAILVNPPALTISTNQVDILCNGLNTGSIQIVGNGGTGALEYSINNGGNFNTPPTNFNFNNLLAGPYTAYIEDANGCTITLPVTINEPAPLVANSVTPIDDSCFNACLGMIVFDVQGGVTPYQYSADGFVFTSNDTIFDLCANNYNTVVTDDNGCTINNPVVINEPTEVTLALATQNETCDAVNGEITATGNGGTAPLTYFLDAGAGQAASLFTGVDDGNHNVLVEDAFGCSATGNINVVADPIPLINAVALTDPLCNGSADGTATVTVTGGVGTIQYSVDAGPFGTNNVFNTLTAGPHTVDIIDDNGCTHSFPFTLNDPPLLVIDAVTPTDVDCFGNATGGLEVAVSGGTPAYQYSFDNGGNFGTSNENNFIVAGTYNIVVMDANNCQQTTTGDVNEPTLLEFDPTAVIVDASCFGVCDGSITTAVVGGTVPYFYNWSNAIAGTTDAAAANVCAGTYSLIVTDDNGCIISDTNLVVSEPPLVTINSVSTDSVLCNGDANGVINIDAPNAVTFTITGTQGQGTNTNANGLFDGLNGGLAIPAGNYDIEVADANGCIATSNTTVYEPDAIDMFITPQMTVCYEETINLSALATGGTQPYSYVWSNDPAITVSNQIIQPTVDVSIDVTVTDANGCTFGPITSNITVTPVLQIDPVADILVCPGETTPTITASAQDGLPTYSFIWDNNLADTTQSTTYTPVAAPEQHYVIVKDLCGFTDTAYFNIDWYPASSITLTGAIDGCVEHTVTLGNGGSAIGGTGCLWDFGDGNTSTSCDSVVHTYTDPGVYDVSFQYTSPDGCFVDSTFSQVIEVFGLPEASFTWSPTDATMLNPTVNFTNLSIDADSYAWNFASYGSSTEENPTFVFPGDSARTYLTCLTAFANHPNVTCVDNFCAEVKIKEDFLLYVPNAFTPDGDAFNQTFKPMINGIDVYDYEMLIFDRWGELIFETHNKEVGWDGTFRGNLVQDGVYVWKIKLKIDDVDDRKTYFGHVSVLK